MGMADAVYGTADHLMLLMGRIADFAAKDRGRKIKNSKSPKSQTTNMPEGAHTRAGSNSAPSNSSVPFYGMAPTFGPVKIPKAYESNTIFATTGREPDAQSEWASSPLEEWTRIRRACDAFQQNLGPEFQPLPEEEYVSSATPFGHARMFRNSEISVLWMSFYEAMLVLIRSHPDMPPAAQVAALVGARQTDVYANEIGRIAAGIGPVTVDGRSDSSFQCSFAESICPLFFAGVQFQDQGRRKWTVERLLDIARYHGSKSAAVCASGCEMAWEKAALIGKGPPYERVDYNLRSDDHRITRQDSAKAPAKLSDRRLLPFRSELRLHFGFGVLGTAEDLSRMALNP